MDGTAYDVRCKPIGRARSRAEDPLDGRNRTAGVRRRLHRNAAMMVHAPESDGAGRCADAAARRAGSQHSSCVPGGAARSASAACAGPHPDSSSGAVPRPAARQAPAADVASCAGAKRRAVMAPLSGRSTNSGSGSGAGRMVPHCG